MKKIKQTLCDADIVTSDLKKKSSFLPSQRKVLTTVALAVGLSASMGTFSSCSDSTDCDSDVTSYADPAADPYDVGPVVYDTTDSDYNRVGDNVCD